MRVLGISDGVTGGVAVLEDNKLTWAINEERVIRKKMAIGFPRASLQELFSRSGLKPADFDGIAIAGIHEVFLKKAEAYDGWLMHERKPVKRALFGAINWINSRFGCAGTAQRLYYGLKALMSSPRRKQIIKLLRREWGFDCPIGFIEHHFAHACTAYFTSGFEQATVITLNGAGDFSSGQVYRGRQGLLEKIQDVSSLDSIGNYYAYVTHLCGFKAHRHEGKITGLAAFGKPVYAGILREFIDYHKGMIRNKKKVFHLAAVKRLREALPRSFDRADLASSMQQVLEETVCSFVDYWVRKAGFGDLACAGGVFANVKLNQRIHELESVKRIFIHPGMGDEGLAAGAAYAYAYVQLRDRPERLKPAALPDAYLGQQYTQADIAAEIIKQGLPQEYHENIERRIAELLAEGMVVARFNGRMEYGPRALGNRSVLYQTVDPSVNDWLNKRLKRTEFMPFAPVTLMEHAGECYLGVEGARHAAEFMTITFNCTDWMKEHCPAVVHVDGTARPQLISKETNPSYYRIIEEYYALTGLPSLINTSFNMHEEPIVCSPYDAIRGFLDSGLDYLAIGNYLIRNGYAS